MSRFITWLTSVFKRRCEPDVSEKSGITIDQASRALARIMLAACYRQHIDPRDTVVKHFLHMRRHGLTPLEYAARVSHVPESEMLSQAKAVMESERLEVAVMPGSGWAPDNMDVGISAVSTLTWTDQVGDVPTRDRRRSPTSSRRHGEKRADAS